jgi:hypothetical protein
VAATQGAEIKRFFLALSGILLLIACAPADADPWAKPGDLALRHDIQLLADAGVLKSPVTAWPIPWAAIAGDLVGAAPESLDPDVLIARTRVMRRLEQVRGLSGLQPNAQLGLRTGDFWTRTFEDTPRDGEQMRAGVSWMGDRFAARAQLNFVPDPEIENDNEWRGDGSYVAGVLGNHILYAGAIDQWWGPSHDDTLIFSSNARPVSGLGAQRSVALPFETRWLSWMGPWNYSLFWGFLESDRAVPNARVLAFRFGFRPMDSLEIGLTRTAQWCGQGRRCSGGDLWDVIVGDSSNIDDREVAAEEDPDNQLAAIDFRWQSPFGNGPWAFYGQGVAEDEAGGLPSRYFGQLGLEAWGNTHRRLISGRWRAHLEYTNTLVHFWRDAMYNTAYEHSVYRSGYRYYGRSLGAGIDGDSEVLSAGLTLIDDRAQTWNGLVRVGEINQRGVGTGRDALHSVSPDELKIFGAQFSHSRPMSRGALDLGKLRIGVGVQYADNEVSGKSETDVQAFVQWTWDYSGL